MVQTILVSGANRGIGLAVCAELAQRGYEVVATARRAEAAEQAAERIRARGFGQVLPATLDVTDAKSVDRLAQRLRADGKRLEALVNNAGVSLSGFNAKQAQATLETNTFGPMRVSDALAGALANGAKVVNVSSGMGHLSGFGAEIRRHFEQLQTREELADLLRAFVEAVAKDQHRSRGWPSNAYSVSKAGLNAFTRILARERPELRVNSVCPGWVRTDMGGAGAPRSVEKGAAGIVWAAMLPSDGPTGGFFRDGSPIEW